MRRLIGSNISQPYLRQMIESRNILLVPDVRTWSADDPAAGAAPRPASEAVMTWHGALLGAPVFIQGQLAGFINLNSSSPNFFTPVHADRLRAFADQAAVAIQNARLFEEARQRAALLAHSHMVINALSHVAVRLFQPEANAVLLAMVEELQSLGISCMVAMRTPGTDTFVSQYSTVQVEASRGLKQLPPAVPYFEFRPDNFSQLAAILAGETLYLADTHALLAPLLSSLPAQLAQQLTGVAGLTPQTHSVFLPLILREQVVGMIAMWSENLEKSDLPTCSIFANQVTLALHNAGLAAHMQHQAISDDLTGLYNQRGLAELGQREVERALRFGRPLVAVMVDIDHFKQLNDRHGYPVGDQVLQELARRLRSAARQVDLVARDGEEFVLLLVESDCAAALPAAEQLRAQVAATPFKTSAGPLSIAVSVGAACLEPHMTTFDELVAGAGRALQLAKQRGRNRVEVL
jgi:diguanylate cyclase (GGDEF)-like protein